MSVLTDILERVAREPRAVLVFDLDSTLFSTQRRNHAILREFAVDVGAPEDFHQALEKLTPADMGWNVVDDLRKRGFRHEPTLARLRQFWYARFFKSEYLRHDEPLPGATEFVNACHAAGATIFYLTGRDAPNMARGTRLSLAMHGFPTDQEAERVILRLKPRFSDDDLEFKRHALEEARGLGVVVACFENEPANANLFHEAFPEAYILFLETVRSPNPPPLRDGIVRLKDFRRGSAGE
jgi:hypothetical protein